MQTVRPQSRSRGPDSGRRDLADTRVPAMSPALALTLRKSGQDPFLPRALAVSTVPGLTTPELPPIFCQSTFDGQDRYGVLEKKWNTHLVVDGHAKVDQSKHRHIHEDTLGKCELNTEYVVLMISL